MAFDIEEVVAAKKFFNEIDRRQILDFISSIQFDWRQIRPHGIYSSQKIIKNIFASDDAYKNFLERLNNSKGLTSEVKLAIDIYNAYVRQGIIDDSVGELWEEKLNNGKQALEYIKRLSFSLRGEIHPESNNPKFIRAYEAMLKDPNPIFLVAHHIYNLKRPITSFHNKDIEDKILKNLKEIGAYTLYTTYLSMFGKGEEKQKAIEFTELDKNIKEYAEINESMFSHPQLIINGLKEVRKRLNRIEGTNLPKELEIIAGALVDYRNYKLDVKKVEREQIEEIKKIRKEVSNLLSKFNINEILKELASSELDIEFPEFKNKKREALEFLLKEDPQKIGESVFDLLNTKKIEKEDAVVMLSYHPESIFYFINESAKKLGYDVDFFDNLFNWFLNTNLKNYFLRFIPEHFEPYILEDGEIAVYYLDKIFFKYQVNEIFEPVLCKIIQTIKLDEEKLLSILIELNIETNHESTLLYCFLNHRRDLIYKTIEMSWSNPSVITYLSQLKTDSEFKKEIYKSKQMIKKQKDLEKNKNYTKTPEYKEKTYTPYTSTVNNKDLIKPTNTYETHYTENIKPNTTSKGNIINKKIANGEFMKNIKKDLLIRKAEKIIANYQKNSDLITVDQFMKDIKQFDSYPDVKQALLKKIENIKKISEYVSFLKIATEDKKLYWEFLPSEEPNPLEEAIEEQQRQEEEYIPSTRGKAQEAKELSELGYKDVIQEEDEKIVEKTTYKFMEEIRKEILNFPGKLSFEVIKQIIEKILLEEYNSLKLKSDRKIRKFELINAVLERINKGEWGNYVLDVYKENTNFRQKVDSIISIKIGEFDMYIEKIKDKEEIQIIKNIEKEMIQKYGSHFKYLGLDPRNFFDVVVIYFLNELINLVFDKYKGEFLQIILHVLDEKKLEIEDDLSSVKTQILKHNYDYIYEDFYSFLRKAIFDSEFDFEILKYQQYWYLFPILLQSIIEREEISRYKGRLKRIYSKLEKYEDRLTDQQKNDIINTFKDFYIDQNKLDIIVKKLELYIKGKMSKYLYNVAKKNIKEQLALGDVLKVISEELEDSYYYIVYLLLNNIIKYEKFDALPKKIKDNIIQTYRSVQKRKEFLNIPDGIKRFIGKYIADRYSDFMSGIIPILEKLIQQE